MFFFALLQHYLWWHYQAALVGYIRVSRNFWWYFFHIFSIPQLTTSLLAPYKRQLEYRQRRFSLHALFERVVLNTLSRLVGCIIRLSIIVVGFIVLTIYTTASLAGFALWLGAPVLIVHGVFGGIWLIAGF